MRPANILAIAVATLTTTIPANAEQDAPDVVQEALGFAQGDHIPKADRDADDAGKVLRVIVSPGKAGFDRVVVVYTEGQGVCKVVGLVEVEIDNAVLDNGKRHKAEADQLIERVVKKLDGTRPSKRVDRNNDTLFTDNEWVMALRRGNAHYGAFWFKEDARPFSAVVVESRPGFVSVSFEMTNFDACVAEQDAADEAAF